MNCAELLNTPSYTWQNEPSAWLAPAALSWVTSRASLTSKLRSLTQHNIQHQLQHQAWGQCEPDEAALLNIGPMTQTWLRHINWTLKNQTWVSARVVIPKTTLQAMPEDLTQLKSEPLGDFLFQRTTSRRNPFQYAELPTTHPLFKQAQLTAPVPPHLVARRSCFLIDTFPLLVVEAFTPHLLEHITT